MTHTPGYQGYLRNFDRLHVSGGGREQPSRKYRDFEVETHGLMADARMISEATRAHDRERFLRHQQAQPSGSTRCIPTHKDSLQAARIVASTKPVTESAGWNWQQGASGSSLNDRSTLVPTAGRTRQPSPLYSSTYSDSIGVGLRPATSPLNPRYPNNPITFAQTTDGSTLPPRENSLNQSLAQAIASLPAADLLLKGNVDLHGGYSRDFGHRGHHPLQRTAGLIGGPPAIHAGSITNTTSAGSYTRTQPTHSHTFPSSSLIGPSGQKVGPHPIEGMNEYAQTGYNLVTNNNSSNINTNTNTNPFLRSTPTKSRLAGDSISEMATTRELFAGSTKRSRDIRIPGYSGYVPTAAHNQLALTGLQPIPSAKDNILAVFNHNAHPAYTGHMPSSVVNVRGPRTPRGKKRLNEGLVASLILDSMK